MRCFNEHREPARQSLITEHNDMWNMSDNGPKDSRSLTQKRSVSHMWKQTNDRSSPGLIDRGLTQSCQSSRPHLPPSFHLDPALQGHLIDPEHRIRPPVFFLLLIALFLRSLFNLFTSFWVRGTEEWKRRGWWKKKRADRNERMLDLSKCNNSYDVTVSVGTMVKM